MTTFAQKENEPQQQSSANLTRSNTVAPASSHRTNPILHLQRTIGNQAVLRLLQARANVLEAGSDTEVDSETPATAHFAHDFSRIPVHAPAPITIQPKLAVNTPGDIYEQDADHIADNVMRMPEPRLPRACACGGDCAKCQTEQPSQEHHRLQTKHGGSSDSGQATAPPIVQQVLASSGQPLDAATRAFFEPRFGQDFSRVRVHTDPLAAQSAAAVAAQAYTMGPDVVFGAGRYMPHSSAGQRLLAHELAHVVQQQGPGATLSLQRFEASEKPKIAPTFGDMMATIQSLITAASLSDFSAKFDAIDMDIFVEISGGSNAMRRLHKKYGDAESKEMAHVPSRLLPRYLFTCRCGLIDMRHFIQMLYIAWFRFAVRRDSYSEANRNATDEGRGHELRAESKSRFAAEDAPSNALGAFTNTGLGQLPSPDEVLDAIKNTLVLCGPVDFNSLSPASQDTIIHYYGDQVPDPAPKKPGDLVPQNQNQTAVPNVLNIKECGGGERSFPFKLDTDDADLKTISGTDFEKGSADLKSGSDIRDFINHQRAEVLKALPTSEKIRMLRVLLGGKVRDDDLDAASRLDKMMTPAEKATWQRYLPLSPED